MKKGLDYILIFIFILLLAVPFASEIWIQKGDFKPLHGTFKKADPMKLNWNRWVNKEWQERQEDLVKKNLKIKTPVVRIQHELDYRLFEVYHMGDLLVGKDGYFFSWSWADKRCCVSTFDLDSTRIFIRKLKVLSDLFERKGKYMRIIIAPSKEEILSDKLNGKFERENPLNDYNQYKKLLDEYNIDYWDLIDDYRKIMDTASHPIYSRTSVHWTKYGASFTTFRLLEDMNSFFGDQMNQLFIKDRELSQFRLYDGDAETTLNLLSRIDTSSNFLYYKFGVKKRKEAFKPTVLTLGDSFYGTIRGCNKLQEIYSKESKYLYYYKTARYTHPPRKKKVKELEMVKEFKAADAFIMVNSSHNLKNYPFGFQYDIDEVIKAVGSLKDI